MSSTSFLTKSPSSLPRQLLTSLPHPQLSASLPSAFQQTFADNSSYHQSLLSQYKHNVSATSLPRSAPGYGAFRITPNAGSAILRRHTQRARSARGDDEFGHRERRRRQWRRPATHSSRLAENGPELEGD